MKILAALIVAIQVLIFGAVKICPIKNNLHTFLKDKQCLKEETRDVLSVR